MAIPPTRLQQILDQWNTHPSEVKTWPRPLESETQYTVEHWLDFIELGCLKRDIQRCHYAEAAIFFMRDDFGETVRAVSRRHPLQSWDVFRMFIVELQESEEDATRRRELLIIFGVDDLDPRLQWTLNRWNTQSTKVRTWPPGPGFRYTIDYWLDYIELECLRRGIQPAQYVKAATFFLRGDFQAIVRANPPLSWDVFKTLMVELHASERDPERRRELVSKLSGGDLTRLKWILCQWKSDPAEVKIWPPREGNDYTIEHWLDYVELGCHRRSIPQDQHVKAATFFLRGTLRKFMKAIKNDNSLTWVQFKELIIRLNESERDPEKMKDLLNKLAGGGLMAGGAAILLPSAAIAALNAVGFTASGVLAGSLAAGVQSVFYGAMTGGLFSLCQSIGATAVMAPPLAIGLGIGALVIGAGCLAFSSSSDQDDWDYDI